MALRCRYIQINKTGLVTANCTAPVVIDGVTTTIDTEGMTIPEMPTDAIYSLYYNEEQGLHWVKVADFEAVTNNPTQLDLIQDAVEKSNDELRQEGADALTLELIASGII